MTKRTISRYFILPLLLFAVWSYSCTETKTSESSAPPVSKVEQLDWSKNASIYEVNVRQYSEEGTFEAVRKDLPRLKELGVDILWFMPIHPIGEVNRKGPLGSYYSVADYKGINPNFGTKEDFKRLVDEAHEHGFKVIIDWVANHTSWDNPWTENKDWYELNDEGNFMPPRGTDWTDVIQLDFSNEDMRAAMTDALVYWVDEMDIDGYRCDVAGKVPTDYWVDAIAALNEVKPVFMLAEDGEPELVVEAFQMNYAWQYAHTIREIAKGEMEFSELTALIEETKEKFPATAYRMYFTSNHDENSWTGTDPEMYGDNFENFAVMSATIWGMPLIYNGQESGLEKQLEFFEKDQIEWDDYKYQDFYASLLDLKKEHKALWNGAYGGDPVIIDTGSDDVYAYSRTKDESNVVVVLNFGDETASIDVTAMGVNGDYTAHASGGADLGEQGLQLEANSWVIFTR